MSSIDQGDLLQVENLSKSFTLTRGVFAKPLILKALQDVSFTVKRGEWVALCVRVRITSTPSGVARAMISPPPSPWMCT